MNREEFNRLWDEANMEFKEFARTGLDLSRFADDDGNIPNEAIPAMSKASIEPFLYALLSKLLIVKDEES